MPIRPFTLTDTPACVALMQSNSPEFFSADECADFESTLQNEDMDGFYVLEEKGTVIACAGMWIQLEEDFASLYWVMVRRDLHGKGVGKIIVDYLLRDTRKHGDKIVVGLDTTENITGFYKKFGFYVCEEVNHGYDDGKTRYDMELKISDYS
jgi:N-acetylglutamate synthase-like GNAT family acetyltransferase